MYTLTQSRVDESGARQFTFKRARNARTCWFTPGMGTKLGDSFSFVWRRPGGGPAHTLGG